MSTKPAFESSEPTVAWLLGGAGLPATCDPDATALIWEGGERTYGELRRRALSLAQSFTALGLVKGDVVMTRLFNRGETFELYFACAYAGLTLVPASFRLTSEELTQILADSGARLLFTEEELAESAASACEPLETSPIVIALPTGEPGAEYEGLASGELMAGPFPKNDPHLVLFSSGTTGTPKGICLSHANIMSYTMQQLATWPKYSSDMNYLLLAAMFNTGGINETVIPVFLVGGTVCIMPSRGWTAEGMIDYIDRWKITHAVIFPTMFTKLFEANDRSPAPLETLRVAITGGEPCPPSTITRFMETWPNCEFVNGYGLTEGGLITLIGGAEALKNPASVGRVAPGSALRITDAAGTDLPVGEVGEIVTGSGSVTMGYWNAPELTAQVLDNGWLRTGDLGRIDDDGYLYLEGRSRDMIISKNQNIFPAEIEATISQISAVLDVAVIGVPDDEFGEAVCAVIVLKRGYSLTPQEVVEHVTAHIASYKKPRRVVFRDKLPIMESRKVDKRRLTAEIVHELSGQPTSRQG